MNRFFVRFAALRVRNFRQLFLGQAISVIGDGLTPVAITFAVLDLTGSGTDLGIVLAAQTLPLAALALVGGVWADRLRREWVMMASDLVRAAVQATIAFLLLSGYASVWSLVVLCAAYGSAEAFFRPAAGGLMPQIVETARLQEANALMGMAENFGWMVGPAVAGILIAFIGPGGTIVIDAATFLVSAAFLATLRVPALVRTRAPAGFARELRDGWDEVRSRRWLWTMLLRTSLVLVCAVAPLQVLGPLTLLGQGHGATAWGMVLAIFSVGMIAGGGIALRYRPKRPMITVALCGMTAAFAPLVLALGGGPWAFGAVQGLRGIAIGVLIAVWDTTLQTRVPVESLARVTAWDWMSSMALWPAGLALAGPLAEWIGVTNACWVSAIAGILAATWVFAIRDVREMHAPTPDPATS